MINGFYVGLSDRFGKFSFFEPGWYGYEPYFKCSAPYTDGVGRQHLNLYLLDSVGCHPDIVGEMIGKTHVPNDYKMIEETRLKELLEIEKKYNEIKKETG